MSLTAALAESIYNHARNATAARLNHDMNDALIEEDRLRRSVATARIYASDAENMEIGATIRAGRKAGRHWNTQRSNPNRITSRQGEFRRLHKFKAEADRKSARAYKLGTYSAHEAASGAATKVVFLGALLGRGTTSKYRKMQNKHLDAADRAWERGRRNPYMGFKKLARKVKSRALAAYIGRKKYGKKAFAKMSAAGRRRMKRTRRNSSRMPRGLHKHWGKVNTILGIAASAFVVYHYVNKYRQKGTV